jgi:hypothetical protein
VLFEVGSEREQEILVERSTRSLQGTAAASVLPPRATARKYFKSFQSNTGGYPFLPARARNIGAFRANT